MKKILKLLMILCFGLISGVAFAQNTKKKSPAKSKSKVETPANITVAKNYEGFPNPTGHTYKSQQNGVTIIISFDSPYSISAYTAYGKDRVEESWSWSQDGYLINAGPVYLRMSEDGRQLQEVDSGVVLNITK